MVKSGNPARINSLSGLAGKRVSVEAHTNHQRFLAAESKKLRATGKRAITIVGFPTDLAAARALQGSRVDAYFGDSPSVAYYAIQDPSLAFAGPPINPMPIGIAFRKGDPLRAAVQKAVDAAYADGTMGRILGRWKLSRFALKR
jgi:polar amino acid transport system substrate-binding protein